MPDHVVDPSSQTAQWYHHLFTDVYQQKLPWLHICKDSPINDISRLHEEVRMARPVTKVIHDSGELQYLPRIRKVSMQVAYGHNMSNEWLPDTRSKVVKEVIIPPRSERWLEHKKENLDKKAWHRFYVCELRNNGMELQGVDEVDNDERRDQDPK